MQPLNNMYHNVSGYLCLVQATCLSRISSCMLAFPPAVSIVELTSLLLPRYHPFSKPLFTGVVQEAIDRSPDPVCLYRGLFCAWTPCILCSPSIKSRFERFGIAVYFLGFSSPIIVSIGAWLGPTYLHLYHNPRVSYPRCGSA